MFFSEECIALSFNGGKDCTVALHLLRALEDSNQIKGEIPAKIKLVHFVKENEFDEITEFRKLVEQ